METQEAIFGKISRPSEDALVEKLIKNGEYPKPLDEETIKAHLPEGTCEIFKRCSEYTTQKKLFKISFRYDPLDRVMISNAVRTVFLPSLTEDKSEVCVLITETPDEDGTPMIVKTLRKAIEENIDFDFYVDFYNNKNERVDEIMVKDCSDKDNKVVINYVNPLDYNSDEPTTYSIVFQGKQIFKF